VKGADSMKSINIIMFLSLFLILAIYSTPFAESENYCHDEKSWKEWDALVSESPNDLEI
jgi:hypothetical protein